MTSSDMHTLVGAYALNSLSERERQRFRFHLNECESCAAEADELQSTAARLGSAVAEQPSQRLKESVLAEVGVTRQDSPEEPARSESRDRATRRIPRWVGGLATAAAVIGLALAGVFGGLAMHRQNEIDAMHDQMAAARERYAPVTEIVSARDAETIRADSSIGGGGTVIMSHEQNRLMFMASQLPGQPGGRDYQVWMMGPNNAVHSAGMLGANDHLVVNDVDAMTGLGVTVEPRGGSPTGLPTTDPVLLVRMPA